MSKLINLKKGKLYRSTIKYPTTKVGQEINQKILCEQKPFILLDYKYFKGPGKHEMKMLFGMDERIIYFYDIDKKLYDIWLTTIKEM